MRRTTRAARQNGYPVDFEEFWSAYPRKTGKGAAYKSWQRIKPSQDLLSHMLNSLTAHVRCEDWQRDDGRFIPLPATWLNQSRWEDQPERSSPLGTRDF